MGTNAMETTEMLQVAFQGQAVERTLLFKEFSFFKSGMNSTENVKCFGQPSTNEKIKVQIE
jgi:hypothetical protein